MLIYSNNASNDKVINYDIFNDEHNENDDK